MNMRRILPIALLALAGVLSAGAVWALGVASPAIDWDVIAGGGGVGSAGAVKIADTIGQPIIGPAQSGDAEICSGFWCSGEVATDTPTPTPTKTPTSTPTPTFTPTPTATPTGALTCPHDWSEPNDSFSTAKEITPGNSYVQIYICPSGDEDWFRFNLAMGQVIEIVLYNLPADYDLYLYDPGASKVAESVQTGQGDETIRYQALQNGSYRALVRGRSGAFSVHDYGLGLEILTPTPTPTQPTGCVDDRFEDNDTCAAAARVTPGTYHNLQICSGDDDFFGVDLKAGDTVTVTILFSHAQGDLDMILFGTDCSTELSRGHSTTDNEQVTGTATADGTYYVMIYGYHGAENSYDMVIEVTPAGPTPTPTSTPTQPPRPTDTPTPTPTRRPGYKVYMPLVLKGRRM